MDAETMFRHVVIDVQIVASLHVKDMSLQNCQFDILTHRHTNRCQSIPAYKKTAMSDRHSGFFIGATPKDAMKLRMTGFEFLKPFVIRPGYPLA